MAFPVMSGYNVCLYKPVTYWTISNKKINIGQKSRRQLVGRFCVSRQENWPIFRWHTGKLFGGHALLTSIIAIVDIKNCNCWYRKFQLLMSRIYIIDINNTHIFLYQPFILLISIVQLLISTIDNVDINNTIWWYQELALLISTIM